MIAFVLSILLAASLVTHHAPRHVTHHAPVRHHHSVVKPSRAGIVVTCNERGRAAYPDDPSMWVWCGAPAPGGAV